MTPLMQATATIAIAAFILLALIGMMLPAPKQTKEGPSK